MLIVLFNSTTAVYLSFGGMNLPNNGYANWATPLMLGWSAGLTSPAMQMAAGSTPVETCLGSALKLKGSMSVVVVMGCTC